MPRESEGPVAGFLYLTQITQQIFHKSFSMIDKNSLIVIASGLVSVLFLFILNSALDRNADLEQTNPVRAPILDIPTFPPQEQKVETKKFFLNSNAKLRSCADINCDVVGFYPINTELLLNFESTGSMPEWVEIVYSKNGGEGHGYINRKLIDIHATTQNKEDVVWKNVLPTRTRAAVSTKAEQLKLLTNKEIITRVRPATVYIETEDGAGSGMIIGADGMVLTNAHVVERTNSAYVTLITGEKYAGQVIGRDEVADLALIRIFPAQVPIPKVEFGNSDSVEQGDEVFTLGFPFGIKGSASFKEGTISRVISDGQTTYIETSAEIHPGNSGGPLVNRKGQIVGVNTATYGKMIAGMQLGETIKLAIPSNVALRLIPMLKEGRSVVLDTAPVVTRTSPPTQSPTPVLPPPPPPQVPSADLKQPWLPEPTPLPPPAPTTPPPTVSATNMGIKPADSGAEAGLAIVKFEFGFSECSPLLKYKIVLEYGPSPEALLSKDIAVVYKTCTDTNAATQVFLGLKPATRYYYKLSIVSFYSGILLSTSDISSIITDSASQ